MISVIGPRDKRDRFIGTLVNTTSRGGLWAGLSPFLIGPCHLYDGYVTRNMENGWQYAKVYHHFFSREHQQPNEDYWQWAQSGWSDTRAVRYPMGKGAVPVGSWWCGQMLSYVEARKHIYIPLYRDAVRQTEAWRQLKEMHARGEDLILWDFDGRDTSESALEIVNNSRRKMGHAFVLKMMLLYGESFDWRHLT